MNIAICDRYDTDITRISEFLDANIKKHMLNHALLEVDTFTSTDELLASPKEYSLIFLGILMPGTDGIEAARQLKDGPNPPIIIFTTKSTEHCLASYNLGVEGYILKPIREEDFEKVFTRLLLPIFPSTHTLNVYSNRLLYHIPVSEIFYIESIGRKQILTNQVLTNRILTSQILTNRAHLEQQILPELTMVQPLVLQVTTHPMVRTEQLLQHLQRLLMLIVQIRSLQMAR